MRRPGSTSWQRRRVKLFHNRGWFHSATSTRKFRLSKHLQARLSALSLGIALGFSAPIAFAQETGPAAEVQRVLVSPGFRAFAASIDQQPGSALAELAVTGME